MGESNASATPSRQPRADGAPRILRVEYLAQPYDWLDLDEMGEVVLSQDFVSTLRENIAHYFSVPWDQQAIFDETGLLITVDDFIRALRVHSPYFKVFDLRELPQDLREQSSRRLLSIEAEVSRLQKLIACLPGPGGIQSHSAPFPGRVSSSLADRLSGIGAGSHSSKSADAASSTPASAILATSYSTPPSALSAQSLQGVHLSQPAQLGHAMQGALASTLGSGPSGADFRAGNTNHVGIVGQAGSLSSISRTPSQQQLLQRVPSIGVVGAAPGVNFVSASTPNQHSYIAGTSTPTSGIGLAPLFGGPTGERGIIPDRFPPVGCGFGAPADSNVSPARQARYEVVLSKLLGAGKPAMYGFANNVSPDGRCLLVSWIDPSGLLGQWNREYPQAAVQDGDQIVAVNGIVDDVDAMRSQLKADTVRLLLQRGC